MGKNAIHRKSYLTVSLAVCILLLLSTIFTACTQKKDGWRQLFNGKDLTGWKQVGPGSHYVEDGLIKSKGGMGLLVWEKNSKTV